MNEKNKTRNTVKVIYPKYYKYWIGPAYSCFTNKPKGPKKRVGLDNMWTGFFSQKTISLLFIYLEYQSSTTIKTGGYISILQNLFLFLDIFYQNFPIHFLNSKPVNSEQKFTIIKFDCISLNKALELISTYCGRQGNALRNDVMNVSDERSERSLKITKCFISILWLYLLSVRCARLLCNIVIENWNKLANY